MTTLDIAIDLCLSPKKVSTTNGGEYHSPCPFCGGTKRFHVWPNQGENGKYWCRDCGKSGDAIQLLIDAKKMSFKEAAEAVGKKLEARPRAHTPVEPKRHADWIPRDIAAPAELWQAKATAFMDHCHKELLQNPQQLAWLSARGINEETVRRFRLGWNAEKLSRKRPVWGLEVKTEIVNGKEKVKEWLVLSVGLVIPYSVEGRIHRLRIRKPEGEPRYLVVPGSGMAPMTIPAAGASSERRGAAWFIIESELDAILIAQDAGDIVGAAALGSVSTRPDGALYEALKNADSILVALDFDKAGRDSCPWWQTHFPQADRWPVPRGKDPGDYRKEGGDIRAWVVAGLPYGLRPVAPKPENQMKAEEKSEPFDSGFDLEKPNNARKPEIIESRESGNITLPPPTNRSESAPIILPAAAKWSEAPGADKRRDFFNRLQMSFYAEVARCFPSYDESGWDKRAWLKENHPSLAVEVDALYAEATMLAATGPDFKFRTAARNWRTAYMKAYTLAAAHLRSVKNGRA